MRASCRPQRCRPIGSSDSENRLISGQRPMPSARARVQLAPRASIRPQLGPHDAQIALMDYRPARNRQLSQRNRMGAATAAMMFNRGSRGQRPRRLHLRVVVQGLPRGVQLRLRLARGSRAERRRVVIDESIDVAHGQGDTALGTSQEHTPERVSALSWRPG
jgi:hypothetical protein